MPMGVVNDSDFEKEIQNSEIPLVGEVVELPTPGRNINDVNVPESLRKIIGETSELEGRKSALDLAAQFNVSPSSVSAYAHGATSTSSYNKPDIDLINHINGRKTKVVGSALTRLTRAMSLLTKEKIEGANAKDISSIAKDMAQVVKMMEPESPEASKINAPQFLVYAPTMIDERKFEVITAKE